MVEQLNEQRCHHSSLVRVAIVREDAMAESNERRVKVLTVRELSEYLGVHPSTIYRLVKQRIIPAFRIGSDWRFNIETIDRWRAEMEAAAFSRNTESRRPRRRKPPTAK